MVKSQNEQKKEFGGGNPREAGKGRSPALLKDRNRHSHRAAEEIGRSGAGAKTKRTKMRTETTPLPDLSRCKGCGAIPALSTKGETAFIFCANPTCPAPVDTVAFRRATVAEAVEMWEASNGNGTDRTDMKAVAKTITAKAAMKQKPKARVYYER